MSDRRPAVDDALSAQLLGAHHYTTGGEQQFEQALPVVEDVVRRLCRRNRVSQNDRDAFRSMAFLKLIDNDYKVLGRFRSECSLRTYLTVVLRRVLLEQRTQEWGKWRPSAVAKKRGHVALRLERLMVRDGMTFDEAASTLRTNFGMQVSTATLDRITAELPPRKRLRVESREVLPEVIDRAPLPDVLAAADESRAEAQRVRSVLGWALRSLSDEDRRILRLRYVRALPIADIAKVLGCEAKPIYRRIERLLATLRQLLESRGVGKEAAHYQIEFGAQGTTQC